MERIVKIQLWLQYFSTVNLSNTLCHVCSSTIQYVLEIKLIRKKKRGGLLYLFLFHY
jgi:hypothetical protein